MATYAIGDIQGCFDCLQNLLNKIAFTNEDTLWFCGDLINRGGQDLATLRWIHALDSQAQCVLGNHDLHALAVFHGARKLKSSDTFGELFKAKEANTFMSWLQQQPLIHHDAKLNFVMVHAGLSPHWSLAEAITFANAFSDELKNADQHWFHAIYGNQPIHPDEVKNHWDQLKFTCNAFTRMRIINPSGEMNFNFKGPLDHMPKTHKAWFDFPRTTPLNTRVIFGHWSALGGHIHPPFYGLDTGCVWGGQLTALRLEDLALFQVKC